MDLELYRAAELGNWDVIRQFKDKLDAQRTVNKDTVLHIISQFCDSSFAVQQILKMKPKLLLQQNAQWESCLHIAARKGHSNVVRAVIHCIKRVKKFRSVLGFRNIPLGNTALHEAVMNSRHEIIQLLVDEDPNLTNVRNWRRQCPLYLAVEKGNEGVVALILTTYKPPTYAFSKVLVHLFSWMGLLVYDPLRTPLHVAAILNYPECLSPMLDKFRNLTKNIDYFGRTALHYAARFNNQEVARQLLRADRSIAYVRATRTFKETEEDEDEGETALHVAVIYGHVQVMELILTYCPDCWRMVTYLARNVIHLAVANEQQEALDFILRKPWASELVNGVNNLRNTPLHLYVATETLLGSELVNYPEVQRNALNSDGFTPLDLVRDAANDSMERQNILRSELEKAGVIKGYRNPISIVKNSGAAQEEYLKILHRVARTQQVVATLIITITFAAAFTIPGGYEQSNATGKEGYPVFLKKAAFILLLPRMLQQ